MKIRGYNRVRLSGSAWVGKYTGADDCAKIKADDQKQFNMKLNITLYEELNINGSSGFWCMKKRIS